MDVFPDFDGLAGVEDIEKVVGALLTIVLVAAVLMLIVSAVAWAIASAAGNYTAAMKARGGVLVALGAAVLAGGAIPWVNWLISIGRQL
ncbi:DUF6112 family protein [Aeromicrobium piscarium]|uniref:Integral membrane protein n=1 Tax=Aeromicrobium piscarium TaxID=2590901 RepID=A0A554S7W3_9ACTN|nr:DUF6112 family protein [Aeromicrobium piscarium]TSD62427.1 hypothetical protein FNM00_12440 [Aeromicrobium piscarium]